MGLFCIPTNIHRKLQSGEVVRYALYIFRGIIKKKILNLYYNGRIRISKYQRYE